MVTRRRPSKAEAEGRNPPGIRGIDWSAKEDPAAFWGPEWRAKLDEALADVAAGRVTSFASDEDFLSYLKNLQ